MSFNTSLKRGDISRPFRLPPSKTDKAYGEIEGKCVARSKRVVPEYLWNLRSESSSSFSRLLVATAVVDASNGGITNVMSEEELRRELLLLLSRLLEEEPLLEVELPLEEELLDEELLLDEEPPDLVEFLNCRRVIRPRLTVSHSSSSSSSSSSSTSMASSIPSVGDSSTSLLSFTSISDLYCTVRRQIGHFAMKFSLSITLAMHSKQNTCMHLVTVGRVHSPKHRGQLGISPAINLYIVENPPAWSIPCSTSVDRALLLSLSSLPFLAYNWRKFRACALATSKFTYAALRVE
mmetsp:Transcript_17335/g.28996  ORF Transcript_17335/g.28996 Transcript_17335/m.28996 type:complete len:293 (+) Transcript_17335:1005-1883(+)